MQQLPQAAKQEILSCLGEHPFIALFFGEVEPQLADVRSRGPTGRSLLCELPEFQDTEALANQMVEVVRGLPIRYAAMLKLPRCLTNKLIEQGIPPILGPHISIVGSWHERQNGLPQQHPESLTNNARNLVGQGLLSSFLESPDQPSITSEHAAYLNIRLEGYCRSIFSNQVQKRFTYLLKSFFGLSLGCGILDTAWTGVNTDPHTMTLFEEKQESFIQCKAEQLDRSVTELLNKLTLNESSSLDFGGQIRMIIDVLNIEFARDGVPLARATRWLFDSRANPDTAMGFMQLAICVEVLLGTSIENEGITKTLSDRCAYLIANSAMERDSLIKEFRDIYQLRSKIVHNGLGAFKRKEHLQFQRLRAICNRVVQRESELLVADTESQLERHVDSRRGRVHKEPISL